MKLTIITALVLLALLLTACGSDPLGIVAREKVRTAGAIEIAKVEGEVQMRTAAVRIAGAIVIAGIIALAVVASVGISGVTAIKINQDNLTADLHRTALSAQPERTALPTGRPPSRRPAITQRRQQDTYTLALPARSESANEIIVIDG